MVSLQFRVRKKVINLKEIIEILDIYHFLLLLLLMVVLVLNRKTNSGNIAEKPHFE